MIPKIAILKCGKEHIDKVKILMGEKLYIRNNTQKGFPRIIEIFRFFMLFLFFYFYFF